MKVSINMSLLPVNLVRKGDITKMRDKNIQKGYRVVLLDFHSELDVMGNVIKMVEEIEERDQMGMAMRPNNKCVLYKIKRALEFAMKVV